MYFILDICALVPPRKISQNQFQLLQAVSGKETAKVRAVYGSDKMKNQQQLEAVGQEGTCYRISCQFK